MRISPSRNVAGYVRAVWAATAATERLATAEERLAPLRALVDRLSVELAGRRGRLNGTQKAEAERILRERPTRPRTSSDRAGSTVGGPVREAADVNGAT